MEGLLARVVETALSNPLLAAAFAAGALLLVLVWGVVSSSYKYR